MTADINVILQLLQRQMAPVPPAYSTVSSSSLPSNSPGLYGTGTPVLHSMYPIPPIQMDGRAPTQVQTDTNKTLKVPIGLIFRIFLKKVEKRCGFSIL